MSDLAQHRDQLLAFIRQFESCAVAFSAGVDSTVVAKAAQLALGNKALAVTAVSPSLAEGELDEAISLAKQIGIRHEIIHTAEMQNPLYVANPANRCYHCKTELYEQLAPLAEKFGVSVVLNGANADDTGDYRPGMQAADEHSVLSPLLACDIDKQGVRQLAADWNLPVADKPAAPCLASRIAYGEEVTTERLQMIDRAEQFLRGHDLPTVRVRYHGGDLARVEVPASEVARLCEEPLRGEVTTELQSLGFKYVTIDMQGFRSGSQNEALSLPPSQPQSLTQIRLPGE